MVWVCSDGLPVGAGVDGAAGARSLRRAAGPGRPWRCAAVRPRHVQVGSGYGRRQRALLVRICAVSVVCMLAFRWIALESCTEQLIVSHGAGPFILGSTRGTQRTPYTAGALPQSVTILAPRLTAPRLGCEFSLTRFHHGAYRARVGRATCCRALFRGAQAHTRLGQQSSPYTLICPRRLLDPVLYHWTLIEN